MVAEKVHKRSHRARDLIQLVVWVVIVVLINYIGSFIFERFDLTSEKRYSLSEASKKQVAELEDIVFVRVYLDGDLPASYLQLRDATREMLDEFRAYGGENIGYEFIDPSADPDEKKRLDVYRELSEAGLQYSNIRVREGDKFSEQIIFPGALVSYRDREIPLQLLKSQLGAPEEIMLNNSIQQLEYELSSTIRKLTRLRKETIAFVEGHGELDNLESADIYETLSGFYNVKRVKIDGQLKSLKNDDGVQDVAAIVIADPDSAFTEKDKFIIDQFVMRGGKVLWLVDQVYATMDSLADKSTTMGLPRDLNLDDQLFKYGVRINSDLVLDMRALPIPIVTGYVGNQPKQEFFPWPYFPLLMSASNHPVVNNLDAVTTQFVSSIDTIARKGIKKTILLATSEYSKVLKAPSRISFNMLREPLNPNQFLKADLPVAVLLEGTFESVFTNRIAPRVLEIENLKFREESLPTKMIVISDGDIMKNPVNRAKNEFFTLGFDRYTQRLYGNKDFILNAINYLCDDSGLIEVRSKEFKIRLLDSEKARQERTYWQILNTAVPILLVLIFGVIQFTLRKRTYSRP